MHGNNSLSPDKLQLSTESLEWSGDIVTIVKSLTTYQYCTDRVSGSITMALGSATDESPTVILTSVFCMFLVRSSTPMLSKLVSVQ